MSLWNNQQVPCFDCSGCTRRPCVVAGRSAGGVTLLPAALTLSVTFFLLVKRKKRKNRVTLSEFVFGNNKLLPRRRSKVRLATVIGQGVAIMSREHHRLSRFAIVELG